MTSDNDSPPGDPQQSRSPAALILGVVFIMALLGILLLYNAGSIDSRTATDPNSPPEVVTGSTTSRK